MKNNLIGISGKIGSGKDTVGNILNYLSAYPNSLNKTNNKNRSFNSYMIDVGCGYTPTYQIKKFADKLKDIVCLLIGCTREQLEDREFKEKELGEEWWCCKIRNLTTGKTYLINTTDNGEITNHIANTNFSCVSDGVVKLTSRKLLQLLGTDCGRQIIHPNIWVNALFTDYKESKPRKGDSFNYYHPECIDCKKPFSGHKRQFICNNCYDTHDWFPNWIITDVRFPNEAQAIKDRGGIIIRVNRDFIQTKLKDGQTLIVERGILTGEEHLQLKTPHLSETALDDYDFDYVIDNNSTIEELIEKVKKLDL